jgi:hypothetical protein
LELDTLEAKQAPPRRMIIEKRSSSVICDSVRRARSSGDCPCAGSTAGASDGAFPWLLPHELEGNQYAQAVEQDLDARAVEVCTKNPS